MSEQQPTHVSNTKLKKLVKLNEATILIVFLALFVLSSFFINGFITANNLMNLVRQTSISGIIALGMTVIIISGGIDLSLGSIVGLSSMVSALLMTRTNLGIGISILIAVIAGVLVGVINAIIIFHGRVPAFIATLGTQAIVRGLVMLISNATQIGNLPESFSGFAQLRFFGLPSLFIVWLVVIAITGFIMSKTTFGRNVYAIGSNPESARLSGISIQNNTYLIYGFGAFMAAIAGTLLASRMASGIPTAGEGYEFHAIAAAVIGGASLSGAEGTVLGTIIGTMFMATLTNSGNLLGIDPFILQMLNGALIVIAVFIDQQKKT